MGNNKISQLQLISIGICYLLGSVVVSAFISSVAINEAWLVAAVSGLCFTPVIFIYLSLIKKHPEKGLFEINEAVFGSFAGKIVSSIYLIFFISLCTLNISYVCNFLFFFVLPGTPLVLIAMSMMIVCVYCAKKGLTPLARISTMFTIICLIPLLFNIFLSLSHANPERLLPIFNIKPLDYLQSIHIGISICYGESIMLMMFIPQLSEKSSMKKIYFSVLAASVLIVMIVNMRELATLGPMISYTTLPSYESVRMIDVHNALSRAEGLFGILLVSLSFFKIMILFYICSTGIAQIFNLKSHGNLLIMLAAFMAVCGVDASGTQASSILWGKNVSPFIWTIFTLLIPLLTLVSYQTKNLFSKLKKRILSS